MSRALHPSTAHFLMALAAAVTTTKAAWGDRDPETLVGFCPRKFPTDRLGRMVLNADERLWQRGRARYGVSR